jgi:hypothetical protein
MVAGEPLTEDIVTLGDFGEIKDWLSRAYFARNGPN